MLCGFLTRAASIASTSVPLSPPSVLRTALSTRRRFNAIEAQSRLFFGRTTVNKVSATASNAPSDEQKNDTAEKQQSLASEEQGEQTTESPKMAALREAVEKLKVENAELLDKYKRALAETENVRARSQREIQQARLFAVQGFCKDLLDVADTLQKAIDSVSKEQLEMDGNESLRALHDGIVMTRTNLMSVFAKHGVKQINPLGEQFDPNFHEAVVQLPPTGEYTQSKQIADVLTVGYNLHDRPIRAAKVAVIQ